MVSPLSLFVAVFLVALVLQIAFPRWRVAVAVATTASPPAIMLLTVWWGVWDRDALWAIG